MAASVPVPKYGGDDDLEVFMKWLQELLAFIDLHQIVGRRNDYTRILTLGSALEGRALSWYNLNLRGPLRLEPNSFLDMVIHVSNEFITPAAATKAQQSFDRVQYTRAQGIRSYVRELHTLSYHIFMPIDEFTLRRQILTAIPQSICNWLIIYKDLSTSTSPVADWVNAIERRERELLEQEAYTASLAAAKRVTFNASRPSQVRGAAVSRTATTATREPRTGGVRPTTTSRALTTSERAVPTGTPVAIRPRVPLADIICHACGQKGHYQGSRECPRTPSSARLHAMGMMENDKVADDDEDLNVHDVLEDNNLGDDGEPFEGENFEGDADVLETDYLDDVGTGAILANIRCEDATEYEQEIVAQMAALTRQTTEDAAVAEDLVKSVKDAFELRGSGLQPRPQGKTRKQLNAASSQHWASNPNVRPAKSREGGNTPMNRQGLTALVKINGVDAYTCWDSGSELDAISPDFVRALGITPRPKETALRIRLGTKGSSASTSYEIKPTLDFLDRSLEQPLDVVNLDRWDLLLGSPFCNKYEVILDYKTRTIRFGNTVLHALTREEEAAVCHGELKPRLHAIRQ